MAKGRMSSGRAIALSKKMVLDPNTYEYDDSFQSCTNFKDPNQIHTVPELIEGLRQNEDWQVEGHALALREERGKNGTEKVLRRFGVDRETLLESVKWDEKRIPKAKLRESDSFLYDQEFATGVVGDPDFIPLLGGPFYKQLYYHDYLRMHGLAFHAYHHDPLARRIITVIRDFTLGRGWRVDFEGPDKKKAKAMWEAFEEVNDLYDLMDNLAREIAIYGETMIWWLPNNATKISYQNAPEQEPTRGIIPRIRLVDPSVIWEIVTYPEDITRVLYYQWVAPTQYQIYTGRDAGKPVQSSKFIFQQIPADQMMHFKINAASNEKRGRSDLFPVLGYLKRLRDSVNYSVIGMQKATAWSIDTTITGSQADVQAYVDAQEALGTIPPAGSEFAHTDKIEREYLSNQGASRGAQSTAFDWCLSMIAIGTGIPVSYFGSHLSGGQTRASALIASEPVAKVFEMRQLQYRRIIKAMAKRLCEHFRLDADAEATFPENIAQDSSTKLRDIGFAQQQGWISPKRAATIAVSELEIDEYEWEQEQSDIDAMGSDYPSPLSTPGMDDELPDKGSAITQPERRQISKDGRM